MPFFMQNDHVKQIMLLPVIASWNNFHNVKFLSGLFTDEVDQHNFSGDGTRHLNVGCFFIMLRKDCKGAGSTAPFVMGVQDWSRDILIFKVFPLRNSKGSFYLWNSLCLPLFWFLPRLCENHYIYLFTPSIQWWLFFPLLYRLF